MTHIVNGMAGNIKSHSKLSERDSVVITAVFDEEHHGFSKLTINASAATWQFIRGQDGSVGDIATLRQRSHQAGDNRMQNKTISTSR